jgi:hypothetical protein
MKKTCTDCSNSFKKTDVLRPISILCCALLLPIFIQAQEESAMPPPVSDTLPSDARAAKSTFVPNPRKAVLYSLIPGGGQIYNRRYWKVPLVYGAIGTLGYFTRFNTMEYRRFRDALESQLKGEPHEFSELNLPASVLRNQRNLWRKNMEQTYIFLTLAYFVQMAEAYVDAHLQDFDDSDDLGYRLRPQLVPTPTGLAPSLAIQLPLHRRQESKPRVSLP